VERGLDPRDFDVHAFGGSCGLFAGAFARDLAVKRVVVPYTASVNCAFGMVASDVVHELSRVEPMPAPAAPAEVNAILQPMAEQALARLADEGFARDRIALELAVDLRYRRQVHQVVTPLRAALPLDAAALELLTQDFEQLYERRYGPGSAFRGAGVELVTFRVKGRGKTEAPVPLPEALGGPDPSAAEMGRRRIYVEQAGAMASAAIYDFERLAPGNVVAGPAVVHTPITTVVIQSGQTGSVDSFRNILVEVGT
jgi:N-methylhydantoinase A